MSPSVEISIINVFLLDDNVCLFIYDIQFEKSAPKWRFIFRWKPSKRKLMAFN